MAGTMVACGGNDKKDDKQATSVEEQGASAKEQVLSVEEQVTVYFNKSKAISFLDSDGQQELEELTNELTAWYEGLNDADKEIALNVMVELAKAEAEKQVKIEEQAKAYVNEMKAAVEAGDMEKAQKIAEESEAWYYGLSDADRATADKVLESMM